MKDHWHGKRVGHIIGGMILMMVDRRVMDIGELKALFASIDVLTFKGSSREEIYAWIEQTLCSYNYDCRSRPRSGKGDAKALHAEDDRDLSLTADPTHHPVPP